MVGNYSEAIHGNCFSLLVVKHFEAFSSRRTHALHNDIERTCLNMRMVEIAIAERREELGSAIFFLSFLLTLNAVDDNFPSFSCSYLKLPCNKDFNFFFFLLSFLPSLSTTSHVNACTQFFHSLCFAIFFFLFLAIFFFFYLRKAILVISAGLRC